MKIAKINWKNLKAFLEQIYLRKFDFFFKIYYYYLFFLFNNQNEFEHYQL